MTKLFNSKIKGLFWTFVDRSGSQLLGFVVTIVLARILNPSDFGVITVASIFIGFINSFSDSGLRDSLVQKKNTSSIDYNTIFVFNLVVSASLSLLIFFLSDFISMYFNIASVSKYTKILSLLPILNSVSFVQLAILQKRLAFFELARIKLIAFFVAGSIAITAAILGFGIWSLIIQAFIEILIINSLLWSFNNDWKPRIEFNKQVLVYHLTHGSRLLGVNLLNNFSRHSYSFFIGKNFSSTQLGLFNRADTFKNVIYENTIGIIKSFTYPHLVLLQDNVDLIKDKYRQIQKLAVFLILGLCVALYFSCKQLFLILLTDKWLDSVIIFKVLILSLALTPFNAINLNVLKALRRTDLFLKSEIIQKVILLASLLLLDGQPFIYLVYLQLTISLIYYPITSYFLNKVINFPMILQIKDTALPIVFFVGSILSFEYWKFETLLSSGFLLIDFLILFFSALFIYFLPIIFLDKGIINELKTIFKR